MYLFNNAILLHFCFMLFHICSYNYIFVLCFNLNSLYMSTLHINGSNLTLHIAYSQLILYLDFDRTYVLKYP